MKILKKILDFLDSNVEDPYKKKRIHIYKS